MLPGVHRVRKRRADGGVTEFWYAWRGGPQILRVAAASDTLLARAVARAMPEAVRAYEAERQPSGASKFFYGLVTRYLTAMETDTSLADRTKRDRRKHLDFARADDQIGQLELRALESKRARPMLIAWRDTFATTPKTADDRLGAVSTVLQWAVDRGELGANPVKDFPRIYNPPDRSHIIWEPHHLEDLLKDAAPEFEDFVDLATHSALRLGDIRIVPLSAATDPNRPDALVFQTGKSNRRRTVVVPITAELRAILDRIVVRHQGKSLTLLNSARGRPWSEAGLESAIQRQRKKALARARKQHGPAASSGIEQLRIHDMRGTAATNYIRAGLDDHDIAQILGWKPEEVAEIRRRYVSANEIALAMVRRMKKNKAGA